VARVVTHIDEFESTRTSKIDTKQIHMKYNEHGTGLVHHK